MKIECDFKTKAWFADKPEWLVTTLDQCEKCGLYYNSALGHKCEYTIDEKIQYSSHYIIHKYKTALIELAKGPEEE